MTIVKVQTPLSVNDRTNCLVYSEGRQNIVQQPTPAHVLKSLGRDNRGFFEAAFQTADRTWVIGQRVKAQEW